MSGRKIRITTESRPWDDLGRSFSKGEEPTVSSDVADALVNKKMAEYLDDNRKEDSGRKLTKDSKKSRRKPNSKLQ